MRRSLAVVLTMIATAAALVACAHPHEVPKPGQSLPPSTHPVSTTAAVTTTGADQTKSVCTDAQSLNDQAISALTNLLAQAQAARTSGDTAAALAAVQNAQQRAKQWSSALQALAAKNIDPRVRSVLQSGITTINQLADAPLTSLANIDPNQVQQDITKFRNDLTSSCSSVK
jgi:uncharacterized protein with LGFP repeats